MDNLGAVRRATARRAAAENEWRESIKAAHAEGGSLRAIAREADVTHVRVLHIVRGDGPSYTPEYHKAHRAVEKARGKPMECSECGTTDPDKIYEWANLTGNYEDVLDYVRLCRTCHRRYDRSRK